jgi:hypothetical protein
MTPEQVVEERAQAGTFLAGRGAIGPVPRCPPDTLPPAPAALPVVESTKCCSNRLLSQLWLVHGRHRCRDHRRLVIGGYCPRKAAGCQAPQDPGENAGTRPIGQDEHGGGKGGLPKRQSRVASPSEPNPPRSGFVPSRAAAHRSQAEALPRLGERCPQGSSQRSVHKGAGQVSTTMEWSMPTRRHPRVQPVTVAVREIARRANGLESLCWKLVVQRVKPLVPPIRG